MVIQTTSDPVGEKDTIKIYGGQNTVMGGYKDDTIEIHGKDNIVLGDGGKAEYDKRPEVVKDDASINVGLTKVETTSDRIKVVYKDPKNPTVDEDRLNDDIDIYGDKNSFIGGVDGD